MTLDGRLSRRNNDHARITGAPVRANKQVSERAGEQETDQPTNRPSEQSTDVLIPVTLTGLAGTRGVAAVAGFVAATDEL